MIFSTFMLVMENQAGVERVLARINNEKHDLGDYSRVERKMMQKESQRVAISNIVGAMHIRALRKESFTDLAIHSSTWGSIMKKQVQVTDGGSVMLLISQAKGKMISNFCNQNCI